MESPSVEQTNEDFVDVETTDPLVTKASDEAAVEPTVWEHLDSNEVPEDPNFKPPKADFDSIGEFCFESDEIALKGNADYKNVLEAIVVLEAQRAKAVKDLNQLQKLKEEALSDPFEFLEQMKVKDKIIFPKPQKIHLVPAIDWSKYALGGDPIAFEQRQINLKRQMTKELLRKNSKKVKLNLDETETKATDNTETWDNEEVNHLKELLLQFPLEENEASKWEKIAHALKNRTPLQVAVWVHEQYDKLLSEGLDGMENKPDLDYLKEYWINQEKDGLKDQDNTSKESPTESKVEISDDEISPDLHDTPEFQELQLLKRLLQEKVVEESSGLAQHIGYKCCRCKTKPIVGVRWHCIDCKPPVSIDFCEECVGCKYETRMHTAEHQLERQLVVKGFLDCDYMQFLGSDYNYLDPNYMPAT